MGCGFHVIGGHVCCISISNRLVLPTSVEDLDMMLLKFVFQKGGKFMPSFLWNLCVL